MATVKDHRTLPLFTLRLSCGPAQMVNGKNQPITSRKIQTAVIRDFTRKLPRRD